MIRPQAQERERESQVSPTNKTWTLSVALARRVWGFSASSPHAVQASKQEREREIERERDTHTHRDAERATDRDRQRKNERQKRARERERDRETPTLQHKITVPSSGGLILTSRPTESPITDWGPMWPGGFARPLSPAEEETETATAVELVLTSADSIQNAYLPWQLTLVGPMKPALY